MPDDPKKPTITAHSNSNAIVEGPSEYVRISQDPNRPPEKPRAFQLAMVKKNPNPHAVRVSGPIPSRASAISREDIAKVAAAIGSRQSEKPPPPPEPPMHGPDGPLPRTWREAGPYLVWVVLILGFGLECVAHFLKGDWLQALFAFVGMVGLAAMMLHWKQIQTSVSGPRWLVAAMMVLLVGLILSPFVEQHRWPFSYPADPEVISEVGKLKSDLSQKDSALGVEKSFADKWRFIGYLRRASHTCQYQFQFSPKAGGTQTFWQELFSAGGWTTIAPPIVTGEPMRAGITLRISGEISHCAGTAQRALTDIYPNPPSKIAANQQTQFLSTCKGDCVQIEIDY